MLTSTLRRLAAPFALLCAALSAPAAAQQNPLVQVADIANSPPPRSNDSDPELFLTIGQLTYFTAATPEEGRELWVTNGTQSGTFLVKDIEPGKNGSGPLHFTEYKGKLFFSANTSATGREIWHSDGTPAGTRLLANLRPGRDEFVSHFRRRPMAVFKGMLWMGGFGKLNDKENVLFKTNGTTVTPIGSTIPPGGNPDDLTVANGKLFYTGVERARDHYLYATNGTVAGTNQLGGRRHEASNMTFPFLETPVGNILYFVANVRINNQHHGQDLCKSDGTRAGTKLVPHNLSHSSIQGLTEINGFLYFRARTTAGSQLFRVKRDGTIDEKDTNSFVFGVHEITAIPPLVYFAAQSRDSIPGTGEEPYVADTRQPVAKAFRLKDINPTTGDSLPRFFTDMGNGKVYFRAATFQHGDELWETQGTESTTRLVEDLNKRGGSFPTFITRLGDLAIFQADNGASGREPFAKNKNSGGAFPLKDIAFSPPSSKPVVLTRLIREIEFKLAFGANNGKDGVEPFITTAKNTKQLANVNPGSQGSDPSHFVEFGSQLWFRAKTAATGFEAVSINPDGSGMAIHDTNPGTGDGIFSLVTFIDELIAGFDDGKKGHELGKLEEGVNGPKFVVLKDINPGASGSNPDLFTVVGCKLAFVANDGNTGGELWLSDGTASGTVLVKDIRVGTGGSDPRELTVVDVGSRRLVFFSANNGSRRDLWVSDLSSNGTKVVKQVNQRGSDDPRLLTQAGDLLFYRANDGVHGYELWRSDGAAAGTFMILDIRNGSSSSMSGTASIAPLGVGRRVVFDANDGNSGLEAWTSDGSAAGTVLLADVVKGAQGLAPRDFVRSGDTIFLTADDRLTGRELWGLSVRGVQGTLADFYGQGCPGTGGKIPHIIGVGSPDVGAGGFKIRVELARKNSAALMLLGFSKINASIGNGCRLLTVPAITFATPTSSNGSGEVGLGIPNDKRLIGVELFAQYFVVDPEGAFQKTGSLTRGLFILIGR